MPWPLIKLLPKKTNIHFVRFAIFAAFLSVIAVVGTFASLATGGFRDNPAQIWAQTEGGPAHSSETLLYTLYTESFAYLRTGHGAAVTVVFLVIAVTLTLLQARVMDKRVHYQ